MAITVYKRTRTLTDEVYSEWSDWAETTDTSPFTDTDLVEYSTYATVDFRNSYDTNFASILALTISDNTPYQATLDFLSTKLDDLTIRDDQKAQITAQMLSQMTIAFTQAAMQTAISLTDKDIMSETTLDNTKKQGIILDKQATKLDADTELVAAQQVAIQQQVIDNRFIKAGSILGDYFGTVGAGGLKVDSTMNTALFNIMAELLEGDYELSIPTSFSITKVS